MKYDYAFLRLYFFAILRHDFFKIVFAILSLTVTRTESDMIISVLNQKGGVGKTTLSVNIAGQLAAEGARVLLLDADPQGSSLDWAAAREDESHFAVLGLPRATLHKDIGKFTADYDHIIIDGPPRVTDLARSAIMAADLVLIPVQPSPYDVWAAEEVVNLIREAKIYKETLKSVFVVNRKITNTAIGRDVVDALATYDTQVLNSTVCQRVVFAEAAGQGKAVHELGESAASVEIKAVVKEILEMDV
jgi:chromosome partitioning protein